MNERDTPLVKGPSTYTADCTAQQIRKEAGIVERFAAPADKSMITWLTTHAGNLKQIADYLSALAKE